MLPIALKNEFSFCSIVRLPEHCFLLIAVNCYEIRNSIPFHCQTLQHTVVTCLSMPIPPCLSAPICIPVPSHPCPVPLPQPCLYDLRVFHEITEKLSWYRSLRVDPLGIVSVLAVWSAGHSTYLSSFPFKRISAVLCCQYDIFVEHKVTYRCQSTVLVCLHTKQSQTDMRVMRHEVTVLTLLASAGSALKCVSKSSFEPLGLSFNQSFMQKFLQNCQINYD